MVEKVILITIFIFCKYSHNFLCINVALLHYIYIRKLEDPVIGKPRYQ